MTGKSLIIAALIMLCACTTAEQRKAAEAARIKKNVAQEIERICSLPQPERDAELKKLKDKTGLELYCAQ